MAKDDPIDVSELRRSPRFIALEPIKGYYANCEVVIHDLSEGGFQIEHVDPLKLASSGLLSFENPKTFEGIEFRVKVVWSRLSSTPNARGKLLYRSGLRVEQAEDRSRKALTRLIAQFTRPDEQSLERKRKKVRDLAKERASRPVIKFIRNTGPALEQTRTITEARRYLRSNPVEALRWYNRAKYSLSEEQIRTLEEMNVSFRDDVLAVWEYLERKIPIALVAKAFQDR